jgi:hypothetical protein
MFRDSVAAHDPAREEAVKKQLYPGTETGTGTVFTGIHRSGINRGLPDIHLPGFQTSIFPSIRALSWFAATPCGPK